MPGLPVLNVREATFGLLRGLGSTTVFGNPGAAEETFLKNFPDDFGSVLALLPLVRCKQAMSLG